MERRVFNLPLSEIIPYEHNPRQNDGAVDAVAESIKAFGPQSPIIVDRNNVIICGHTRYKAAQKLGLDTFPCLIAENLSGEQVRAYRLDASGALSVAFSQGGDLLGGADNANYHKRLLRKAMNTFFCKTSNKFQFLGRVNEDVNTYTCLGNRGHLFFTYMPFSINQTETQKSKGGMSEMYLDSGTYIKSFYTVMFCPSSVKIGTMGSAHKRIHHLIDWNHCVPCIISPRYKK